jgi:small basic protein
MHVFIACLPTLIGFVQDTSEHAYHALVFVFFTFFAILPELVAIGFIFLFPSD